MIMARIRGNNLRIKEGGNRGRIWKNYTKNKLIESLENIDWSELYSNENMNEIVHIFTKKMIGALNELAPEANFNNKIKYKNSIGR